MSAFVDMGGYAFYVWGSYALGLGVFLWNGWSARAQRQELQRRARLDHDGGKE